MRRLALLALLAVGLPAAAYAEPYLLRNATLVTMTGQGNIQADIRIENQRIHSIGPALTAAADDTVMDLDGAWIMPGLAEMHAHVPAPAQGQAYRDDVLFLWLSQGITTVRGMLGHPDHLTLRRRLAAQEVLGPRLVTSGPSFNGDSVSSPAQARRMVREQHAAGYDFLKIHPGLSRTEYDAMADEARRLGIRFAGHVPAEVGLEHAIAEGQHTIDHLDGMMQALVPDRQAAAADGSFFGVALAGATDLERLPGLLEQMRARDVWLVPTETLLENFAAAGDAAALARRPEADYLPADLRQRYRSALDNAAAGADDAARALVVRKRILAAAHEAGVGILLGSDSPQIFNVPGFSIHRELAAMVEAGLSPEAALHAGTVAPARYLGRPDDFGRLDAGLAADLVVLGADPTADIAATRDILGVMVRGRWLDRRALDDGLQDIARRYR